MTSLLKNKKIRSLWDKQRQTHWFCAVDICRLLTGADTYQKAKSHWKNTKQRHVFFDMSTGYVNVQLSLPAADGKFYMMDVIDLATVVYLARQMAKKHSPIGKRLNMLLMVVGVNRLMTALTKKGNRGNALVKQALIQAKRSAVMHKQWVGQVFKIRTVALPQETRKTTKLVQAA